MTKHSLSIHEHLQSNASQYKQKTQHPSDPFHKHTTYFNTPRLKTPSLTPAATQQTSHRPTHSHYNRHKINMCHIHTSIVSMHLATRGNNKIQCTPPPHTSISEWVANNTLGKFTVYTRGICHTFVYLK